MCFCVTLLSCVNSFPFCCYYSVVIVSFHLINVIRLWWWWGYSAAQAQNPQMAQCWLPNNCKPPQQSSVNLGSKHWEHSSYNDTTEPLNCFVNVKFCCKVEYVNWNQCRTVTVNAFKNLVLMDILRTKMQFWCHFLKTEQKLQFLSVLSKQYSFIGVQAEYSRKIVIRNQSWAVFLAFLKKFHRKC